MLKEQQVAEIVEMLNSEFSHHYISKRTGVSRFTIAAIAKRLRKGLPVVSNRAQEILDARKSIRHGTPEYYRQVQDEAWAELRKCGRDRAEHAIGEIKRETAF